MVICSDHLAINMGLYADPSVCIPLSMARHMEKIPDAKGSHGLVYICGLPDTEAPAIIPPSTTTTYTASLLPPCSYNSRGVVGKSATIPPVI